MYVLSIFGDPNYQEYFFYINPYPSCSVNFTVLLNYMKSFGSNYFKINISENHCFHLWSIWPQQKHIVEK